MFEALGRFLNRILPKEDKMENERQKEYINSYAYFHAPSRYPEVQLSSKEVSRATNLLKEKRGIELPYNNSIQFGNAVLHRFTIPRSMSGALVVIDDQGNLFGCGGDDGDYED